MGALDTRTRTTCRLSGHSLHCSPWKHLSPCWSQLVTQSYNVPLKYRLQCPKTQRQIFKAGHSHGPHSLTPFRKDAWESSSCHQPSVTLCPHGSQTQEENFCTLFVTSDSDLPRTSKSLPSSFLFISLLLLFSSLPSSFSPSLYVSEYWEGVTGDGNWGFVNAGQILYH